MSNITAFSTAGLPSVSSLSSALRSIETDASASGMVILKMDRTGHWVFGADQTEVEDNSIWAINPFSFVHGYIAWGEGTVLAEKMVSVAEPLPEVDAPPSGAKRGWEMQIGFTLACTNGEDEGLQARYTTTSVGGKKAVQELATAIAAQVDKDQNKPVPMVALQKEHYQHKTYGRIHTPVFNVVDWASLNGDTASDAAELEVAADEPTSEEPRRRRRGA